MPFPLIPTALGIAFALVWAFIATMIVRDSQRAARREREAEGHILPLGTKGPDPPPVRSSAAFVKRRKRRGRRMPVRAAS